MSKVFLLKDPILHPKALLLRFGVPLTIFLATWWTTRSSQQFYTDGGQNSSALSSLAFVISVFLLTTADSLGQARTRVFDFQLSLPISTRKFVSWRLVAHLLPGLVLFSAFFLCLISQASSFSEGLQLFLSFAALFSAWICFALSLFAWRPELPKIISPWAYSASFVLGTSVLGLASLFPHLALPLNVLVGLGLVSYLWDRVPETMRAADDELYEAPPSASRTESISREKTHSFNRWLARQTSSQPWFYGLSLGLFFYSAFYPWGGHGLLVSATMVMFFTVLCLQSSAGLLRNFGHLPIPWRTFAAWILLPPALIILVGTCAGHLLKGPRSLSESIRRVTLSLDQSEAEGTLPHETWNLQVPGELLQLHWGKEPVLIKAPDGETVTIQPLSPYEFLPFAMINPYEVDSHNSSEFIAWRLSQAIQDSYGITISPEDLRKGYLRGERFDRYQFARDYPDLKVISAPQGRLLLGLSFNLLAWVLAVFALTARPPQSRTHWISRTVLKSVLAASLVLVLVSSIPLDSGEEQIHTQFRKAVEFQIDHWIATSPPLAAVLCLFVLVAAYRFGVRRIERMEVPSTIPFLRGAKRFASPGK